MEPHETTVWEQAAPTGAARIYWAAVYVIGAFCMGGIVVLTGMQVVFRYVMGASLFWPEEAARALLIAITFLLAGASYQRGEMAAVDSVAKVCGPAVARIIRAISLLFVLALLANLIWNSVIFAEFNSGQIAAAMQISVFWIYILIPIGLAVLGVHVLLALFALFRPSPGSSSP